MPLPQILQTLAESLSGTDVSDSKQLIGVHEQLTELKGELPQEAPEGLLGVLDEAIECVTKLLWQEADGSEDLFDFVTLGVHYAQEVLEAIEAGAGAEAIQRPQLGDAPAATEAAAPEASQAPEPPAQQEQPAEGRDIDVELLTLFVNACQSTLDALEHQVLALEDCEDEPALEEAIAENRRGIHTIKGECGVLSLQEAQELCHDAEQLIDDRVEAGKGFPDEAILALIDWLRAFVDLISEDPNAPTPSTQEVTQTLVEARKCLLANPASEAETEPQSDPEPTAEAVPTAAPDQPAAPAAEAPVETGERVQFKPEVFDDPLLGEVLDEMRQHLDDAEAAMLSWSDDLEDPDVVDVIFRAFHTIKGVGGFMQLETLVRVAHKSETLLDDFRKGAQSCTPEHLTLLFRSRDAMNSLLEALTGAEAPLVSTVNSLITDLEAALGANGVTPAPASPEAPPEVASAVAESAPEAAPVPAEPVASEPTPAAAPTPAPAAAPAKPADAKKKKVRIEKTVKVGTTRLDSLVDMVGELVVAQQMVSQDPSLVQVNDDRLSRNLLQVGKITRDLQEAAMHLRMVPLRPTFQKMSRLVHDVARKSGKTVNLVITGEDTELDRNVVEEIGDPLVHLVRNAIDHGLESPADRLAAGKSEKGSLELKAFHRGGSIVIEMTDDGRGLNRARIFEKCVERGLVSPDMAMEEIPDSELFMKIFQPGFSTAAVVTDISGRGVGLDVVRRKIEALRGKIEIESREGEGTTFTLSLPLTLAIIDGMIVRIGTRRYVIPTLTIEQSFRPEPDHLSTILGQGELANVRGTMVPVHRLKDLLALSEGTDQVSEGILILVEGSSGRVCLLVDDIIGQHQIVIKSISKALPGLTGISGGAILGDGTVALIIDADGLLADTLQGAL